MQRVKAGGWGGYFNFDEEKLLDNLNFLLYEKLAVIVVEAIGVKVVSIMILFGRWDDE